MRSPDASTSVPVTFHVPNPSHVDAKLADLRLMAATFRTMADDLDDHISTVLGIEWKLPFRGDLLSPVTSARCAASIIGLAAGTDSLLTASIHARLMAVLLDLSVAEYELAEAAAGELVDSLMLPVDLAMTGAALAKVAMRVHNGDPFDSTVVQRVAPEAISLVTQTVSDAVPGSYGTDLATIEVLTAAIVGPPRRVHTRMTSGPGSSTAAPQVRSVSDAADRIPELYKDADSAGHIQVQRTVDPATGRGAWTVIVPGTSTFAPNGKNAFNGHGNLIAASGRKSPAEDAVATALRQAMAKEGVAGKGEPVMLVGHSQGGMVATNLARHAGPDLNISHVVTYGSPVGHLKVPQQTSVLNVENIEDPVARTDGRATGDGEPNRVRATFSDPGSLTGPDGKPNPVEAHDMSRYARNYRAMSADQRADTYSPLTTFERSSAQFFEGEHRTYSFDLSTADEPAPVEPPKPHAPGSDVPLGRRPGLSVK